MIEIQVPGSKSITNRALLLAALAKGTSELKDALESDDTKHMIAALRNAGVKISRKSRIIRIRGGKIRKSRHPIFCGNSGTVMRFLGAILAAQKFESVLIGDKRMNERPIADLLQALNQLGAKVGALKKNGLPPIKVSGPLRGGVCRIKGNVSSQFLSGLLLAAPLAEKNVTIFVKGDLVSKAYVDVTLSLMEKFGVQVKRVGYRKFSIRAPQRYHARKMEIEGDASSASYFWGISTLTGETIDVINIPKTSLQPDLIFKNILSNSFLSSTTTYHLQPTTFPDSAMTLAVLAVFRKGKTILTGLANLRVKECDRLHALTMELRKIGARVKELKDGLEINGNPEKLRGAKIKTYNDHRIAMCFGMVGFVLPGMKIENPSCVKKTYPNFWKDLHALKKKFHEKNIILTGMRGSGKSRLGALLGRWLGRRFYDIDELIEQKAKISIPKIVARHGWRYFRRLESQMVKRLRNIRFAVIATGGGTLMYSLNVKILRRNGKIIFLESAVASLKKRLAKHYDRPPLTRGEDFLSELETIYRRREKRYREIADAVIDVSHQTGKKKRDFDRKLKRILPVISRFGLL